MIALAEFVKTGVLHCHKCRNCGRSLYFGGVYWWHYGNESSFCVISDANNINQADPFTDADASLLAAAPELLLDLQNAKQLHICLRDWVLNMRGPLEGMSVDNDIVNAFLRVIDDHEPKCAAIAKAEGR